MTVVIRRGKLNCQYNAFVTFIRVMLVFSNYLNDICVLETGTNTWTRPTTLGTMPSERGETPIIYDSRHSRLLTFGGWANRWYGDTMVCNVSDVVGPTYAIESILPVNGPITGT